MRKGPFDSSDSPEFLADLGLEELNTQAIELNMNHNHNELEKSSESITEATAWIINEQGSIELIAQSSKNTLPSGCLFN